MKLVQKLNLALILGISLVLAVNGFFRVHREVAIFRSDRVRDQQLVGLALGAAFAAVWRAEGEGPARTMLAQANAREGKLTLRWMAPAPATLPDAIGALAAARTDEPVTRVTEDAAGRFRRTHVTLAAPAAGVLEVAESLAPEESYVRRTILDTALTTAVLALVSAALSLGLGAWLVGGPVKSLASKARRVGRGDFGGPLRLRGKDELAELAVEMNSMCDRLVDADRRGAAEAAARIAALEQLRHADRLMTVGKLGSGIAHELGTPLNVVGARAAMIADGEASAEEAAAYARIIVEACDQMTRIIRQLLDFARPRGPERAIEDVRVVAERTVSLLQPTAAKKGVELSTRSGTEPALADVDAAQIQQVLSNLVMNAVQAMARPGSVVVAVSSERARFPVDRGGGEAEVVCVRVQDEGAGIAPEHLAHVFEPFFTTKDVGQGTGLGLSVAFGIVREHGGFMEVTSLVGQGTIFAVYLPVKAAA